MVYGESNNDINNHENTKETIIKTSPFTVDYINNITKRSLDIRSEIENLINQTPFLSEPHKKEEGRNSTKPDTIQRNI